MSTVNRGTLRKQVAAGMMFVCESRNYDEMTGQTSSNEIAVCKIREENGQHIEGVYQFRESDFKSKAGCAYNDADKITLIIDSNSSYQFISAENLGRRLGAKAFAAGIVSAPALDAEVAKVIKMIPNNTKAILALLTGWSKAWHEANIAAPVGAA